MELPQQQLQAIGRTVARIFKTLVEMPWTDNQGTAIPSRRRIAAEEERFRLWARTLGLFQTGHASLDYRVRDASFIKASLTDLLMEVQEHVQNLSDIALGTRLPLEQDEKAHQAGGTGNDNNFSDDESSLGSSLSSIRSFQEAEFRLSSVTTRLDSLYKLASRIRSPQNRQQRSTQDLYKHLPESQRAEYIQNQEQIEVSLVAYVQQQQLVEWINDKLLEDLGFGREELIEQYASASHWLIARAGMANARRKQQFIYWKKHAQLLGRDMTEEAPAVAELPVDAVALPQPATSLSQASKQAPAKSMATSVTKMDLKMIGPEDMRSVISHRSRVSTVASPRGENLAWPPAPKHLTGHSYFTCPYCGILCPDRYLTQDDWRIHQIHDLQPYHCTYEDCSDPSRLYGVKQEWIDHENQHRRVWHCHSHEAEFETQPEYLQHLKEQHPEDKWEDYTPEVIAAVVGASAKPHRDCPFCPTLFSDVTMMQKHVRYHLERLALYALPEIGEDKEDESASETSSDSHQVIENRGRQDSIGKDFAEDRRAFLTSFAEDNSSRDGPTKGRVLLSEANLQLTQPSSSVSWLDTYLFPQHVASSGSNSSFELYTNQGQWDEEEQLMKTYKMELGTDHPDTLTSMSNLASTYMNQGRWEEAKQLQVQVMESRKIKLGTDHPDTLTSISNLALIYQGQGRWEEAEKLQVQVMETCQIKLGTDHSGTLNSMRNLASIYEGQGRFEEAEQLQVQVMETCQIKLGTDHSDTLNSMSNLASIYKWQGRWEEAEQLQMQVMESRRIKLGADHPDTLTSIDNLALDYQDQGRWEEAEQLLVQVMESRRIKLGADHPDTLTNIDNLASIYKGQGRWEEAEKLQVQVMETRRIKLGADHPDTLTSMNNLASIYQDQGRLQEAEQLLVQVMESRRIKLGADHPDTLTSIDNLALNYQDQGRLQEAEQLLVQVMESRRIKLGVDHPDTLTSIDNLALNYQDQGRLQEAEQLQVQVMETRQTVLGADHPDTLRSMNNLAHTWNSMGKETEAIDLMQTCVRLREINLGPDHPHTRASALALDSWQK